MIRKKGGIPSLSPKNLVVSQPSAGLDRAPEAICEPFPNTNGRFSPHKSLDTFGFRSRHLFFWFGYRQLNPIFARRNLRFETDSGGRQEQAGIFTINNEAAGLAESEDKGSTANTSLLPRCRRSSRPSGGSTDSSDKRCGDSGDTEQSDKKVQRYSCNTFDDRRSRTATASRTPYTRAQQSPNDRNARDTQ